MDVPNYPVSYGIYGCPKFELMGVPNYSEFMGVPNLKETFPVGVVVFQGLFHGAEDGALAGGGAADVIEGAAVGFPLPSHLQACWPGNDR